MPLRALRPALAFLLFTTLVASGSALAEETPPSEVAPYTTADDPRIPMYTKLRPRWGAELMLSPKAFGGKVTPTQADAKISGVSIQVEYQPQFLQSFGVLGLGPSFGYYYVPAAAEISDTKLALYSLGGQLRYQARFLRNQWVVPVAGYAAEYMRYSFRSGSGSAVAKGPFFGAMILLNIFEPSAAAEFYAGQGVQRSYLVGEVRKLTASDAVLNFTGNDYYAGLRMEF